MGINGFYQFTANQRRQRKVLSEFKEVVDYANSLGMEVMVDINPALFEQLEISYDDLSFSIRWVPMEFA